MKKIAFNKKIIFAVAFLYGISTFNASALFAAGHGCSTQEADRDGDGVPDRKDDFPDDPTRTGNENRKCGDQVPAMQLFFIPFGTDPGPMTGSTIETSSVTSLIACSDDGIGGTIKNILGDPPSSKTGTSTTSTGTPSASTTGGSGTPSGNTPPGSNPSGNTPSSNNNVGTPSFTDGTSTGSTPSGNTPGGNNPSGNTPGSNPGGSTPGGNTPSGNTPGGNNPSGSTPSGNIPGGNNPSGNTPSGDTPGNNPAGNASGTNSNTSNPPSSNNNNSNAFSGSSLPNDLENLGAPLGPGGGIFPNHEGLLKTLDCATRVVNGKIVPCKEIFNSSTSNSTTPWPPSYDQIWKDEKCGQKSADGSIALCVPTDKGMVVAQTEPDKVELFILQLQNMGVPLQLISGIIAGDLGPAPEGGERSNPLYKGSECGLKDSQGQKIQCRSFGENLLVMDSSTGVSQVSLVSLVTSSDINALPAGFVSSAAAQPLNEDGTENSAPASSFGEEVFYCGEKDPWGRKVECRKEANGLRVSTILGSEPETLEALGFSLADSNGQPGSSAGQGSQSAQCGVPGKDGAYQKCACPLPGRQNKKIDKNKIRLKADFPADKTTYYVDDSGVVLKTHSDKKISDLSCLTNSQMKALETEIQRAAGNTDLSGTPGPNLAS